MHTVNKKDKIYVAGHRGMVGSAITRELKKQGYEKLILRTHSELDLTDQGAVNAFFREEKPDLVFVCAAKVGGIEANRSMPSEFLYDNSLIALNIINAAYKNDCKKLEFLGSSCIYPRMAPQPIKEEYLLSSELEETNEGYALAKITGLKYCDYLHRQYGREFFSVMPCNLYGPGDNYDPVNSHVLPAMIRRFHEAKLSSADEVVCWGDGTPLREFLHVDDLARLCVMLMEKHSGGGWINAGSGSEISIKELAELTAEIIGYKGKILWDSSKPGGTPRKLLDVSEAFGKGWMPKISLREGIQTAYEDYLSSL